MKGKEICEVLKRIRMDIAHSNGISYEPHECHHEGDCSGTCPLCEREASEILKELRKREKQGIPIHIDKADNNLLEFITGERDGLNEIGDNDDVLMGDVIVEPGYIAFPRELTGEIATPLLNEDTQPEPDPDIIWDLKEDTPPIVTNPDRIITD